MTTLKKYLSHIGLETPTGLLLRRKLLLKAADAAEQLHAAEVLDQVCRSWGNLPDTMQVSLFESAGEANDDRNRITITIHTEDLATAEKAIKAFVGRDFGKEGTEIGRMDKVYNEPSYCWSPGLLWPSHFRKVMDAVAEMEGPYTDSTVTIAQIREWVAAVVKATEKLFK